MTGKLLLKLDWYILYLKVSCIYMTGKLLLKLDAIKFIIGQHTEIHKALGSTQGTGDAASKGYYKYKEDVELMKQTGLEGYRFSISWSRLIPDGRGRINQKGLDFYNNLINELVRHGIEPHITLLHYDLPQILQDEYGGWLSPRIMDDFTTYADVCFREFGDRISHWTTLNEANIFAIGGYGKGSFPPKRCSHPFGNCPTGNSTVEPYIVAHHMLLAHSSVASLYKNNYQAPLMILIIIRKQLL